MRAAALLAYNPWGGGIARPLEDWRPDVVHFHNIWPLLTPAAIRKAKQAGATTVLTLHNSRFACPGGTCSISTQSARQATPVRPCIAGSSIRCAARNDPRRAIGESLAYGVAQDIQRALHMLDRWVDAFVAPSRYVASMLHRAGIHPRRVAVIPHGVPVRSSVKPRESRYALYAGRITPEKGVGTLIEAARAASDVPIAVAGDGPMVQRVRSGPVQYLGQLDRRAIDAALAAAAYTVLPSECHENLPYGVLESFEAGRPVIASSVGGLPEVVVHETTGLVVSPGSPEELAEAMQRLWRDPQLTRELGVNALQAVRERFSLELQVERTVELYEQLSGITTTPAYA
jgi:glycosyltransferase involved in cell wall biosynthesis